MIIKFFTNGNHVRIHKQCHYNFLMEIMKRTGPEINKSDLANPDKLMHIFIFENLEFDETIQVFHKHTKWTVLAWDVYLGATKNSNDKPVFSK